MIASSSIIYFTVLLVTTLLRFLLASNASKINCMISFLLEHFLGKVSILYIFLGASKAVHHAITVAKLLQKLFPSAICGYFQNGKYGILQTGSNAQDTDTTAELLYGFSIENNNTFNVTVVTIHF